MIEIFYTKVVIILLIISSFMVVFSYKSIFSVLFLIELLILIFLLSEQQNFYKQFTKNFKLNYSSIFLKCF